MSIALKQQSILESFRGMEALIGAFIGFAGALFVYLLNVFISSRQRRQEIARERIALLNLVFFEVSANTAEISEVLAELRKKDRYRTVRVNVGVNTEAWSTTNIRLSQLLDEDTFEILARYYSRIDKQLALFSNKAGYDDVLEIPDAQARLEYTVNLGNTVKTRLRTLLGKEIDDSKQSEDEESPIPKA